MFSLRLVSVKIPGDVAESKPSTSWKQHPRVAQLTGFLSNLHTPQGDRPGLGRSLGPRSPALWKGLLGTADHWAVSRAGWCWRRKQRVLLLFPEHSKGLENPWNDPSQRKFYIKGKLFQMGSFTKQESTCPAGDTPAVFLQLRRIAARFSCPLIDFLGGNYTHLSVLLPLEICCSEKKAEL